MTCCEEVLRKLLPWSLILTFIFHLSLWFSMPHCLELYLNKFFEEINYSCYVD